MRVVSPCATVLHRCATMIGLFLFATLAWCGNSSPESRAGIELVPGDGWTKVANTQVVVPGTPLSAWAGPEGSSLVVHTSLPIPAPDAEALGKELATRWSNLPGVSIGTSSFETYSGLKAARVEAVGLWSLLSR